MVVTVAPTGRGLQVQPRPEASLGGVCRVPLRLPGFSPACWLPATVYKNEHEINQEFGCEF